MKSKIICSASMWLKLFLMLTVLVCVYFIHLNIEYLLTGCHVINSQESNNTKAKAYFILCNLFEICRCAKSEQFVGLVVYWSLKFNLLAIFGNHFFVIDVMFMTEFGIKNDNQKKKKKHLPHIIFQ